MQYADLHIHTNASDGLLSPEEVVWWACKKQLKAISITDHDTISGVVKALRINNYKDYLEIVPGIELNSDFYGEEIHVLGYYINCNNEWFISKLEEIQLSRYYRAIKMIKKLNDININISMEQVEKISKGKSIGRPHIARVMIEKGYVNDLKSAFDKYIGKNRPAYVDRYKLSTKQAIQMISDIGGIPVLAHPGLLKEKSKIYTILNQGFKGIEVYHIKHDKDTVKWLEGVAKRKELIITGGSDCHGILVNKEPVLGTITINFSKFLLLKKAAENNY